MIDYLNPFEYEGADKLDLDQILDFYIPDFNYSRFVRSKRNIFLVGERGTGKTMTLLFNSFPVEVKKAAKERREIDFSIICVHVPCNTPLIRKSEYALLETFQGAVISEHFLVFSIMYAIVGALSSVADTIDEAEAINLKSQLEFVLDVKFPSDFPLLKAIKAVLEKENERAQTALNIKELDAFYDNARSFSTGVMPLLTSIRELHQFKNSHFAIMLDDAHDLNAEQVKVMNSWIAYRDNSVFSFKVATAKVGQPTFLTESGGAILEGHDFTLVDMELPYQNRYSSFGKLAREIVQRRLEKVPSAIKNPDDFFPMNAEFQKDLKESEDKTRKEAERLFPEGDKKQIGDYVYKKARAEYFRSRDPKANRPPYSGFDILVHISTGVVRNLLEPCYWMYDKVVSENRTAPGGECVIDRIPPTVQSEIILERSKRKWDLIREGLDKCIVGCSRTEAEQLYKLFDNLAILFRERLLHHGSEPRAIVFTISEVEFPRFQQLMRLLEIARKAQILYSYSSSAKDSGRRETYYVPNRILWPDRALDPHGQHARVSIKARDLWAAAAEGRQIPFSGAVTDEIQRVEERDLFDG